MRVGNAQPSQTPNPCLDVQGPAFYLFITEILGRLEGEIENQSDDLRGTFSLESRD
jgi:hypothetical protein